MLRFKLHLPNCLAVFFLLVVLPNLAAAGDLENQTRKRFLAYVKENKNLSPAEVSKQLGGPRQKARQILYGKYIEQWIYDDPALELCVEFIFVQNQAPRLLRVHLLRKKNE
jgi:hypothetical protein